MSIINHTSFIRPTHMIDFKDIFTDEANTLLDRHRALIEEAADHVAQNFYAVLMQHNTARSFLSEDVVQQRLMHTQKQWIMETLAPHTPDEKSAFEARQSHIGRVHARIELPLQLMMLGVRLQKRAFFDTLLKGKDCGTLNEAHIQLYLTINDILDYATYLINDAYMRFENELEQETRLFSATYASTDLALEIMSINASLQNWLIDILASGDEQAARTEIRQINETDFWLWIEHRIAQLGNSFQATQTIERAFAELEAFQAACREGVKAEWRSTLKSLIKRLSHGLQLLSEEVSEDSNNRDPLTHLLNRRMLDGILRREHQQVRTHNGDYALLMIDVDHFKQINDTYGHTVGDAVLREVAQIIRQNLRVTDLAFRYGGEEILLLMPLSKGADPLPIAEKLRQAVSEGVHQNIGVPYQQVTISIGVSQYSRHPHPDYSHLLKEADAALYRAKEAGRNRVVLYDGELI